MDNASSYNSVDVDLDVESAYWELPADLVCEICACGHPVSRHELVGTEYARCGAYPGKCYCSGGVRVAGAVLEDTASPSGSKTNGRFFRRRWKVGGVSPLVGGIAKALEGGGRFVWKIDKCDLCADSWAGDWGVGYLTLGGRGWFTWKAQGVTDVVAFVCGPCMDMSESVYGYGGVSDGSISSGME